MDNHTLLIMSWRLLLAAALGALIGFERETHGRPAGLRTHILVTLGSALFTIVSSEYPGPHDDTRIAAQIVSGIGFLGAGTIIRQGSIIRGLTTAASLWTVAAIGMGVGAGGGLAYLAVVASVIVFVTLSVMSAVERRLLVGRRVRDINVVLANGRAGLAPVIAAVSDAGASVGSVHTSDSAEGSVAARIRIHMPQGLAPSDVTQKVSSVDGVTEFDWD